MSKVPKWKAIVILATVLICIYGMIDLPKSKDELIANWNKNIRLGLDLKGGTLLVLQIQLQDASKAVHDAALTEPLDEVRLRGAMIVFQQRQQTMQHRAEDILISHLGKMPAQARATAAVGSGATGGGGSAARAPPPVVVRRPR